MNWGIVVELLGKLLWYRFTCKRHHRKHWKPSVFLKHVSYCEKCGRYHVFGYDGKPKEVHPRYAAQAKTPPAPRS